MTRTAVVTGAGRGIGRAVARQMADDGYRVVCVDLDEASASATAAETSGVACRCDVRDVASLQTLAEKTGAIDVLVNNAGIWRLAPLAEVTAEHYREVMDVNVFGTLACLQVFAPRMPPGSAVVNLTSLNAAVAAPGFGIYPATKAAIVALTRQAAVEWSGAGIRVNAVAPGLVVTEATGPLFGAPTTPEAFAGVLPGGRLGTPEDVARVVAFLASPAAEYLTGQVVEVDGGLGAGLWRYLWRATSTTARSTVEDLV